MKKGLLALLLVVVLVIIVSPGIIGKLAERSLDENLNWAATESGILVVSSQSFERGWFSSDGRHRIELGGALRSSVASIGANDAQLPALIITTHIDHGLFPISSLNRERGSLMPGLGSAVSTMTIEQDGDVLFAVPGTIYTQISLTGELQSSYALDSGAVDIDDGTITWESGNIDFSVDPASGRVGFDGSFGAMSFSNEQQTVSIESLAFHGNQGQTQYGFAVGDVSLSMGEMSVTVGGNKIGGMRRLSMITSSALNDGDLDATSELRIEAQTIPGFGEISFVVDVRVSGADAAAIGRASKHLQETASLQDPSQILASVSDDLKDVFAAGLDIDITQLDIDLPMGSIETRITVEIPASNRADFEWLSMLLSTVATVDVKISATLVDLAVQMNPQAGAILAMGYLKKNGDTYEMNARYERRVVTINGAPMPIPFSVFQ